MTKPKAKAAPKKPDLEVQAGTQITNCTFQSNYSVSEELALTVRALADAARENAVAIGKSADALELLSRAAVTITPSGKVELN